MFLGKHIIFLAGYFRCLTIRLSKYDGETEQLQVGGKVCIQLDQPLIT